MIMGICSSTKSTTWGSRYHEYPCARSLNSRNHLQLNPKWKKKREREWSDHMRTVRQLQPLSERQVSTAKVFIRYGKFNLIFFLKKNLCV